MNRNLQEVKNTGGSYKNLISAIKPKYHNELTRRVYLNELPLKPHLDKPNKPESYRRYNSSSRNITKELQLNLSKTKRETKAGPAFSDRKATRNKENSLTKVELSSHRYSKFGKNKLFSSTSKLDKLGDKSTALSTLLSNHHQREQKLKEERKKHEEGKNCKVIVIDGSEEIEHYVEVNQIEDILNYLRKEYPKTKYYRAVPVQITLDYLLTQTKLSGQFLNGQSLYLKAAYKQRSTFEDKQSLSLQDFQIIKLIGSGGFSKVFLCRFKKDGQFYAMKLIDKEVIVKNKKKNIIMNQRNIMKTSHHPFLIDMKFSFETQKFLVFIVEYCPGGELFGLIKKYKRLTEDVSRFYIIEIFLGLSYLHQNNVVYRDIKPENILLGQDGHVKVADLGLAKPDMFEGQLAYSFCGSPEYMSPEMILQVGHTYPVDFYCMGALLYQLLIGLPPFYSRDTNQIYEAVLSEQLQFPQEVLLTSECKSLLKSLLCKDAKQRLGSIHGVKQILAHPWFGKNAYKSFLEKKIDPPITFDSVGRIDLDRHQEKHKKQLEEVLKIQKSQSSRFKREMKQFYFDYRGLTDDSRRSVSKEKKQKSLIRSSSSQRYKTTVNTNVTRSNYRKSSERDYNKTINSLNSSRR